MTHEEPSPWNSLSPADFASVLIGQVGKLLDSGTELPPEEEAEKNAMMLRLRDRTREYFICHGFEKEVCEIEQAINKYFIDLNMRQAAVFAAKIDNPKLSFEDQQRLLTFANEAQEPPDIAELAAFLPETYNTIAFGFLGLQVAIGTEPAMKKLHLFEQTIKKDEQT